MQAPSAPLVADLTNDSSPPVAKATESAPPAAAAPLAGETPAVPAAAVEEANASNDLPADPTDKRGRRASRPNRDDCPDCHCVSRQTGAGRQTKNHWAAASRSAACRDRRKNSAGGQHAAADDQARARARRRDSAARGRKYIDRSIIDTDAADESADTPAVVRTPAAESPGAERPALTAAEVDERLSRALPAAQFTKVPLFKFIEFVAELTGLPIQLDEPALKRAGKSRQSAVTVKLNETTAGDALCARIVGPGPGHRTALGRGGCHRRAGCQGRRIGRRQPRSARATRSAPATSSCPPPPPPCGIAAWSRRTA